ALVFFPVVGPGDNDFRGGALAEKLGGALGPLGGPAAKEDYSIGLRGAGVDTQDPLRERIRRRGEQDEDERETGKGEDNWLAAEHADSGRWGVHQCSLTTPQSPKVEVGPTSGPADR